MALILNIETATKNCSVSLAKSGKTIVLKELNDKNYSHAEKLHEFIEEVLSSANVKLCEIQAIAVSKGPGSYTGLRIGVSAAKGLCFALSIPLISVDTLQSLAKSIQIEQGIKIPLIDARRMEVYCSVFDSFNEAISKVEAIIIDSLSFNNYLINQPVYFFGDGAEKCKAVITHENAAFIDGKFPSANEMSELSYQKFCNKDFEDTAYFEPFYLKDFMVASPKNKL